MTVSLELVLNCKLIKCLLQQRHRPPGVALVAMSSAKEVSKCGQTRTRPAATGSYNYNSRIENSHWVVTNLRRHAKLELFVSKVQIAQATPHLHQELAFTIHDLVTACLARVQAGDLVAGDMCIPNFTSVLSTGGLHIALCVQAPRACV